jgi:hypothetical protein
MELFHFEIEKVRVTASVRAVVIHPMPYDPAFNPILEKMVF